MPNSPAKLVISQISDLRSFCSVLGIDQNCIQATYIYEYLKHLGAINVVLELAYFDRDYLDEFSVFYSRSAHGYPNTTTRAHFFKEEVSRQLIESAASGLPLSIKKLQDNYLGFSVIRPIKVAPFGRTVLTWYPDQNPDQNPRIMKPSRQYECHFAGIKLTVFGLAWQQQDQGVGACATIGLWTLLHSSALNERHAVPTTVTITRAAHKNISSGYPIFPSKQLQLPQIMEAVKELGLRPHLVSGDAEEIKVVGWRTFSEARLGNSLSSLISSGYPCLMAGVVIRPDGSLGGGHVNVCVGYRSGVDVNTLPPGQHYSDGQLAAVYIHDDNIGPAVRFTIGHFVYKRNGAFSITKSPKDPICLIPDNPTGAQNSAVTEYGFYIPGFVLSAVEDNLRTSSDTLTSKAIEMSSIILTIANTDARQRGEAEPVITMGTRFVGIVAYFDEFLKQRLESIPNVLSRVRLHLQEQIRPISLYIGVIRLANSSGPVIDLLYDTTDSDLNHPIFATICFDPVYAGYVGAANTAIPGLFGPIVNAY